MHIVFHDLKEIALEFGYNLVLHGSLDRDLDLIAIPWLDEVKDSDDMIKAFADHLDGMIEMQGGKEQMWNELAQGRKSYVINLRRGETHKYRNWVDAEYYLGHFSDP